MDESVTIKLIPEPMTPAAEHGLRLGLAALGLAAAYNTDADLRTLVRLLAGLGLRPVFRIEPIEVATAGPAK